MANLRAFGTLIHESNSENSDDICPGIIKSKKMYYLFAAI
jgi:hypothetical protein